MITLSKPELVSLGYIWGGKTAANIRSWLQFADDAAIISNCCKDAQALLNIFSAWCKWANMIIRIDKCCAFGMHKKAGEYCQFEPALSVGIECIPPVQPGSAFKYLGKLYDFEMKNELAKLNLTKKLESLLDITSKLKVKVQVKLKIVKLYIYSQIRFELRLYQFGATWIDLNLDSKTTRHVRGWLEMPISSCVKEMMSLPTHKGGLAIPLLKNIAAQMQLQKRNTLKNSSSHDINHLWSDSSLKHISSDALLVNNTFPAATKSLKSIQVKQAEEHYHSLGVQGAATRTITDNIPKSSISTWASNLETLQGPLHNFAMKALQQQLPTLANLAKWKRVTDPFCPLCNQSSPQTNKHVLSNCSSPTALSRYTDRHNAVLEAIAEWIHEGKPADQSLHADLPSSKFLPISDLFEKEVRPDLALANNSSITIVELTVCHETNLLKSKEFKMNKYKNIMKSVRIKFPPPSIHLFTIEVSTLGFVADTSELVKIIKMPKMPKTLQNKIAYIALEKSYSIYCSRNSANLVAPINNA
jgi:hypothetical protein